METDGQFKGRHLVVTKTLIPGAQNDVLEAVRSHIRSRKLLKQAFDDGSICIQMRNILILFLNESSFFSPHFCFLDQFVNDPAATVIRAAGHQMVPFCCLMCQEGKAQLLSPILNNEYFFSRFGSVVCIMCTMRLFMLTELNEVLDKLKQGPY